MVKVTLELEDTSNLVKTKIENLDEVTSKTITINSLVDILSKKVTLRSRLLCPGIVYYVQEGNIYKVVFYEDSRVRAIRYYETIYTIPLPKLCYIVSLQEEKDMVLRFVGLKMFALTTAIASLDTTVCRCPISNVNEHGAVCWGSTPRISMTSFVDVQKIIDAFWASGFNNDIDGHSFTPFVLNDFKLSHVSHLYTALNKKSSFPSNILIPHRALAEVI